MMACFVFAGANSAALLRLLLGPSLSKGVANESGCFRTLLHAKFKEIGWVFIVCRRDVRS